MRVPVFLTFFCVLLGCDLIREEPPPSEWFLTLTLNGESWAANRFYHASITEGGASLGGSSWDERADPYHQELAIAMDALTIGVQQPISWREVGPTLYGALFVESDGDAILGMSEAVEDGPVPSVATVTRFDTTAGVAEGTFQGTFVIDPIHANERYRQLPDTLVVTDGRFRLPILDTR